MDATGSTKASPPAYIRDFLQRHELKARKGLGQNFLVDRAAMDRILRAANLSPGDVVVEVGPGPGFLTRELASRASRVIAVEKDEQMAAAVREDLQDIGNVSVLLGDMLQTTPDEIVADNSSYKVVANLPYYVAAPILRMFLETRNKPTLMVVLLQREVAENVAASPGRMGILSVAVQLYARPTIVGMVKAESFMPAPKVDSAIVRLDVRSKPAVEVKPGLFFKIVKAGFSAPRKQILNPLAKGLGIERGLAREVLALVGIDPHRRAETLSLEEWGGLCKSLEGLGAHAV